MMSFRPNPNDELTINGETYSIAEHPAAPGMPYGQEGRAGIVYRLLSSGGGGQALKVFKPRFRLPYLVSQAEKLSAYADLPGLQAARRTVLTPQRYPDLLRQHPDLTYAALMPWIEGPTWLEIVLDKKSLSPQESIGLAQSLIDVLSHLELAGIAHCDLSGPNVMLPALAGGKGIALIDLEGFYAPGMFQPQALSSGSAGYAHLQAGGGLWSHDADRFAGAVLLAEILGWIDDQVCQAAWGESFFEPKEMQREGERFHILLESIRIHYGEQIAEIFAHAWFSKSLNDCPLITEWVKILGQLPEIITDGGNMPKSPIITTFKPTYKQLDCEQKSGHPNGDGKTNADGIAVLPIFGANMTKKDELVTVSLNESNWKSIMQIIKGYRPSPTIPVNNWQQWGNSIYQAVDIAIRNAAHPNSLGSVPVSLGKEDWYIILDIIGRVCQEKGKEWSEWANKINSLVIKAINNEPSPVQTLPQRDENAVANTEPKTTLICPRCGNQNSFSNENCTKCNLPLASIRDILSLEKPPSSTNIPSESITRVTPYIPALSTFPSNIEIGEFVLQHNAIFPDMGNRVGDISAIFINALQEKRQQISRGMINRQEFYFVYFPHIDQDAHTIIAVRIEPQGKDLYVEWRRYAKLRRKFGTWAMIWVITMAIITYGLSLFLLLSKAYKNFLYKLDRGQKEESQLLESSKHELIVRTVLREACKSSDIPPDQVNLL